MEFIGWSARWSLLGGLLDGLWSLLGGLLDGL